MSHTHFVGPTIIVHLASIEDDGEAEYMSYARATNGRIVMARTTDLHSW